MRNNWIAYETHAHTGTSDQGATVAGAGWDLISDQLLAATANVTFSNIPTTYRHLQLYISGRVDNPAAERNQVNMIFNADSATNYANYIFGLQDSTAMGTTFGTGVANGLWIGFLPGSSAAVGQVGSIVSEILNAGGALSQKTVLSRTAVINATAPILQMSGGRWLSTSPATSITFRNINAFASGSRFSLYGMR